MTARYYYDCPIEAAYMAENFKMKFFKFLHEGSQDNIATELRHFFTGEDYGDWLYPAAKRFYIHPESLHLLEPKINDVFHDAAGDYGWGIVGKVCGDPGINQEVAEIQRSQHLYALLHITRKMKEKDSSISIIQRYGNPFIWPKKEGEEHAVL